MTIDERIKLTMQAANSFSKHRWEEIENDSNFEPYTDENLSTLDRIFWSYNELISDLQKEARHGK